MSSRGETAPATGPNALPHPRRPRWAISLDDLTKILGVAAVIVGVGKYIYDKVETAAQEAQERSISYIEAWGDEPLLGARESLYSFWVGQPDLIAVFGAEALSTRQYKTMLTASVFRSGADGQIRAPLLLLDNFYSQMSFCAKSGLCDQQILAEYFCSMTRKNVVAYSPFYDRIRDTTGDHGIGAEMAVFAKSCEAERAG